MPAASRPVPHLLGKRLIFVTGKGGVGKSLAAVTLGMVASRHGKRTMVVELSGQERVPRLFAHQAENFDELEIAPRLFTISVDPQHAMEEYLRVQIGVLGQALGSSRLFQAFAMATPGMRELLSIGKVWELAQFERRTQGAAPYDLVIVDSPATGHGVGMLRTPQTFAEIARVGPIAHQAGRIAATIADRSFTGIVAVATPEEMPVNETLALAEGLAEAGLKLDVAILNALYPQRFSDAEANELDGALRRTRSTLSRSAIKAALSEHARRATQREQRERLVAELDVPVVELPYVFADVLGAPEIERLAGSLEAQL